MYYLGFHFLHHDPHTESLSSVRLIMLPFFTVDDAGLSIF